MLNSKILNQMAAAYEAVVEKHFKKLGYTVKRLDSQSSTRKRPDFLISDRAGGPQMLCEVKTILSAGYLPESHAHVSMQDENLAGTGFHTTEIDLRDINDGLASAVRKRAALVSDEPKFAHLPLLVAFRFDFFADFLRFLPRRMDEDVSGILTIARRDTSGEELLSDEELEQRARANPMSMFASGRLEFVLVRNKDARRVVPKSFQLQCITEGYDESL